VDVSASLHNQILFAIKAFYSFLDMRHAALIFGNDDAVTVATRWFCSSRTSMTTSLKSPPASRQVPISAAERAAARTAASRLSNSAPSSSCTGGFPFRTSK
jgi:hypothetical protein